VAWSCAALVLAITSLSAFIRLSQAGLGCDPWPQCYAQSLQATGQRAAPPADGAVAAARITHRVVAVAALLLVIALVMTTLSKGPILWPEGRMALGLLALALFLAILGRWTTDARIPAVMLGNLLAGFAMFALSCRLAQSTHRQPAATARQDRLARWARLGVVVLVGQIILGGLVSAGHAGLSCPQLLACDMAAGSWQFLNPFHETPVDVADPINPAGALVHGLHRAWAVVVAAVLLALGIAAWRSGRRAGATLVILLLVLQATLGALLVALGLPLSVALAHNAVAALLLAAVLGLAVPGSRRFTGKTLEPFRPRPPQEKVSGSPSGPSAR
jgi:cytochrome c oxidase assembly protein subunit 15